ncbi:MAG: ABC transporter ATP-binding protein [Sedimentisphaerales bacterium]
MDNNIISISNLRYSVKTGRQILDDINFAIPAGAFVAVLGENGAGKTTLLDLVMGFRVPTSGQINVMGMQPHLDHWQQRKTIAYLSEKIDMPGDWSVREFLDFNRYFYEDYSIETEKQLLEELRTDENNRIGNLSAGEIRRAQIIAALSARPKLVIIDEISAVLDIIGRRKFMRLLCEQSCNNGATVVLATNIIEDLANFATDIFLISKGKSVLFAPIDKFLNGKPKEHFSQLIADALEGQ